MFSMSYRLRLIMYSSLLVIFLSATLAFSYKNTRDVVLNEVKNNLDRTVQLFNSQLVNERSELKRYSNIVSDDLRIQEYMFVAVRVGSDSKPLKKLYDRLFGWLPIDRKVIVSDTGQALVGGKHTDLVDWVNTYKHQVMGNVFYMESEDSLELVAISPIVYQDDQLGFVAVTHSIDENWLFTHKQNSNGHLFLTKNGKILQSTFTNTSTKTTNNFEIEDGKLFIEKETFFTYPIKLPVIDKGLPRLWFAISETDLLNTLRNHGQITLILIAAGSIAILWLGVLIFRNFSRPIAELMNMTNEISEGRLPRMAKSQVQN